MSSATPLSTAERRRLEMAEKRAKLAALRKAREDREASLVSSRASPATTRPSSTVPGQQSSSTASRTDEIEALLRNVGVEGVRDSLLSRSTASRPDSVDERASTDQDAPDKARLQHHDKSDSDAQAAVATSGHPSTEKDQDAQAQASQPPQDSGEQTVQQPPPPPPKPKELYDKGIQTADSAVQRPEGSVNLSREPVALLGDPRSHAGGVESENAEQLRARILAELEQERKELDAEIAEEKRKTEELLERERAQGLSGAELSSVLASTPFLDFISQSTKVVQRALADSYDYLKDYSIVSDEGQDSDDKAKIKLLGSWADSTWGKGRSVTAVDWSTKFPELFVAAYNKNPLAMNEPHGIACVWNLHSPNEPEYVFHAQSDLLSIAFSPFHPNLVIGGTYSGQILIWDTRSRNPSPVLKTPLSSTGHTHPVYSLTMVGTQNAHNLISASTDGMVCAWTLDMVARPQEALELVHQAHNRTDEVSVTCLGFPQGEPGMFWCGTEEGNVYNVNRHDRAGAKAGLVQQRVWKGHSGPVTSIDFHPIEGPVDLSNLFITSGVDWTVKIWASGVTSSRGSSGGTIAAGGAGAMSGATTTVKDSRGGVVQVSEPIMSMEGSDDYVYDARWHPHHPAVFASVDGAGKLNFWNINVDTEVPVLSILVGVAGPKGLNKVAWNKKDGKRLAVGSSDGSVYVYDVSPDLVTPGEDDWEQLRRVCTTALEGHVLSQ
ncbi:hypothetical protein OIV83_005455 [Microbotryomycetes sp. JL201]|nr:hypothetical protein OIV83_005455 [Microbotryomycetes sp. JL201]